MALTTDQTVGSIVAENPARARVFEKHRIDYCCGGKLPLAEACERRRVDIDTIVSEIEAIDGAGRNGVESDWATAPLGVLADHIVDVHHAYLAEELPRIETMTARVAKVHGDHAPEVNVLHEVFQVFRRELEEHAAKEEQVLFPWIKRMEDGERGQVDPTIASTIHSMEHEHDDAGAALERFRELTNGFVPPEGACNTWRVLYASLAVLEQDMHVHIHKENSILFPRALALEASLRE